VGDWADLYVAHKSTEEIVVRGREGATDAAFDYLVFGLRIGFEEATVVQPKRQEAYLPSMKDHYEIYEQRPALRGYNALERFTKMAAAERGIAAGDIDLSRAASLREAIQVYDPAVHGPIPEGSGPGFGGDRPVPGKDEASASTARGTAADVDPAAREGSGGAAAAIASAQRDGDAPDDLYARSFRSSARDLAALLPVGDEVEPGDVLVMTGDGTGLLGRCNASGDPLVVGVVAGDPGLALGATDEPGSSRSSGDREDGEAGAPLAEPWMSPEDVPVALSGIVRCRVDAGYGSIRPGDLLMTSPTAGHAMRADEPAAGTIFAKALESLESGTGLVRVLVTLR
jgi:hypothetical protein